jgi:sugar phosphate isomerase/epimerase
MSLNTATVPQLGFLEVVELASRHGVSSIAPWRHLLDDLDVYHAAKLLRDRGMSVSSLCRGGMFTAVDPGVRASAIDDNRRAIDDAAALRAEVLVLVCGPVVGGDVAGSFSMVEDGIAAVVDHARAAGVRLGIEPLHPMMAADRSVVTTLRDGIDLLDSLAVDDVVGAVVDTYHVWWDRSLPEALHELGDRVVGLHVSDWSSPLTGGLLSGRAMMGDGVIDLPSLVAQVTWDGPVEVEVISDTWAAQDADSVLETVVERFASHV